MMATMSSKIRKIYHIKPCIAGQVKRLYPGLAGRPAPTRHRINKALAGKLTVPWPPVRPVHDIVPVYRLHGRTPPRFIHFT